MADPIFVGATYIAPSATQNDEDCVNWYPEVDPTKPDGSRGKVTLYPTPGLTTRTTLPSASAVRGLHTYTGGLNLYAVSGNILYSLDTNYNSTQIATISSASGPVSITDNGVSLYITDGTNRYAYTPGTSTFAVATDGGFTGGNQCDILDNYIFYSRPNSNQWGCTNVLSSTSGGLNFAAKISAPDNLVGLIADHRQVFLIGENTTEVWVDVGSFPFPFQIVPGTTMQHGCVATFSISRLGESTAWLTQDTRGRCMVIQMSGYSPIRISTHAVENAINNYGTVSDAIAYTYQQAGHEFYVLNFPTADATWVYDVTTTLWHRRDWRDPYNKPHRDRGNCAAFFNGEVVVGDWQNGKIYKLDQQNYTADGQPIICVRRAKHMTEELKQVYYHDLQIQFQPGVGLQTGQGTNPQAMLRWSDDGGFTWSNEHWVSIGMVGNYTNRALWRRLGQARDRIFEVQVSDPVYRVIVSAELDYTPGCS